MQQLLAQPASSSPPEHLHHGGCTHMMPSKYLNKELAMQKQGHTADKQSHRVLLSFQSKKQYALVHRSWLMTRVHGYDTPPGHCCCAMTPASVPFTNTQQTRAIVHCSCSVSFPPSMKAQAALILSLPHLGWCACTNTRSQPTCPPTAYRPSVCMHGHWRADSWHTYTHT